MNSTNVIGELSQEELKRREFISNLQFKILEAESLRFFVEQKIDKETVDSKSSDRSKDASVFLGRIKKTIDSSKKLIANYSREMSYNEFFSKNKKSIIL